MSRVFFQKFSFRNIILGQGFCPPSIWWVPAVTLKRDDWIVRTSDPYWPTSGIRPHHQNIPNLNMKSISSNSCCCPPDLLPAPANARIGAPGGLPMLRPKLLKCLIQVLGASWATHATTIQTAVSATTKAQIMRPDNLHAAKWTVRPVMIT